MSADVMTGRIAKTSPRLKARIAGSNTPGHPATGQAKVRAITVQTRCASIQFCRMRTAAI